MEPVGWFLLVFLVLLKIPVVYLCYVVWWAIKDPPAPEEGLAGTEGSPEAPGPEPGSPWWRPKSGARRPVRRGPHGSPARRPEPALTSARSKEPA